MGAPLCRTEKDEIARARRCAGRCRGADIAACTNSRRDKAATQATDTTTKTPIIAEVGTCTTDDRLRLISVSPWLDNIRAASRMDGCDSQTVRLPVPSNGDRKSSRVVDFESPKTGRHLERWRRSRHAQD